MFIAPFPGSGLSYNFLQSNTQSSTTGTVTFTGVSFGSVISPQRYIVISVAWVSSSNTLSSATIGGVSATINAQDNNIAGRTAIIIANVPTGTSGTVILNFTGSATDILASTYALI